MGQACALERGVCVSILLPSDALLPIPNLSEERFASVYTLGKQLAPKVCQAKHKVTSVVYVAYRLGKELHPLRDGEEISKRIKVLQSFDHPNFCQLREAFDTGRFTVLVFTQLDGKKLLESISKSSHLSEKQVAGYILQILRALNQGELAGLHHGAICPKNFFLNSKGQLSITDLGLAGLVKALPVMTCHSVDVMEHLAPEVVAQYNEFQKLADRLAPKASRFVLRGRKEESTEPKFTPEEKAELVAKFTRETITPAADVWAIGTILHQLLMGQVPFKGKDLKELSENIIQKDYKIGKSSQISSPAKNLLMKMMKKDPSERPSLQELLADPWFGDEGEGAAPATPLDAGIVQQLGSIHAETHFKKMMMRIISSKVPGRKIKELTKAFKALDQDADGQLTMAEFKAGITNSGIFSKGDMDFEAAFNEIDANHSGSISVDEFLAATIDSQQEVVEGVLFDAFKAVDEDQDGRLCLEELERVVKSLDTSLGNDHVEMMMHLLENEVDGPVTFQEFKELIFREGGRSADVKELQSEVKTGGLPACARVRRKCRQVIDARPCRTVEKPAVEDVVNAETKKQESPHKAKSKAKSKSKPK